MKKGMVLIMCMQPTPWEETVNFHGHICPGLAIGYRVAEVAMRELQATRDGDEELVAIVENDSCAVDGIQVLTGCTFGKGNLVFLDHGKQAYTLGNRKTGKAVRIAIKGSLFKNSPADKLARVKQLLEMPEEEFCTCKSVSLEFPPKARIFKSVNCAQCGEPVAETRARVRQGAVVCIPCADQL